MAYETTRERSNDLMCNVGKVCNGKDRVIGAERRDEVFVALDDNGMDFSVWLDRTGVEKRHSREGRR